MTSLFYQKLRNRHTGISPVYAAQYMRDLSEPKWEWLINPHDSMPLLSSNLSYFAGRCEALKETNSCQKYRVVEIVSDPYDEESDSPYISKVVAEF